MDTSTAAAVYDVVDAPRKYTHQRFALPPPRERSCRGYGDGRAFRARMQIQEKTPPRRHGILSYLRVDHSHFLRRDNSPIPILTMPLVSGDANEIRDQEKGPMESGRRK